MTLFSLMWSRTVNSFALRLLRILRFIGIDFILSVGFCSI